MLGIRALSLSRARRACPMIVWHAERCLNRQVFPHRKDRMNIFSPDTLPVAAVVAGVVLLIVIFTRPIKKIVKFVLNAVFGFVLLFLVNYFGRAIGVSLEMTLVNCLVAGFIGIPGVLILLALKYLL